MLESWVSQSFPTWIQCAQYCRFSPQVSGGGDIICGACGRRLTWQMETDSQPGRQKECWHSLTFPIRSSPGIVFISLWWGWVWGREERILSEEASSSGGVEEARIRTVRDFRPQPLRSQPKEEIKVKRSDKRSRDKIMTTGVGLFGMCGLETSSASVRLPSHLRCPKLSSVYPKQIGLIPLSPWDRGMFQWPVFLAIS